MGVITAALVFGHHRAPRLCRLFPKFRGFHHLKSMPWTWPAATPTIHLRSFCSHVSSSSTEDINVSPPKSSPPSVSPHLFIPSNYEILAAGCGGHNHDHDLLSKDPRNYFQFLNLGENKIVVTPKSIFEKYSWERDLLFPEDDVVCIGASHGWLAFFNHRDGGSLFLLNPFTSDNTKFPPFVSLPPVESLPYCEATSTAASPTNLNLSSEYIGLIQNPKTLFTKMVLSSTPSLLNYPFSNNEECIAVVIGGDGNELASCRLGDASWFGFGNAEGPELGPYSDALYSSRDGCFYALRGGAIYSLKDGLYYPLKGPKRAVNLDATNSEEFLLGRFRETAVSVEAWHFSPEFNFPNKKTVIQASLDNAWRLYPEDKTQTESIYCRTKRYLVESSLTGDLLLVERRVNNYVDKDGRYQCYPDIHGYADDDHEDPRGFLRERWEFTYGTTCFKVYKLEHKRNVWEPVECLGEQALMVGLNHSISLSTADYPMLQKNSIYFSDDDIEEMIKSDRFGGHDFGIYNLEAGIYNLEEDMVGRSIESDIYKFELPPVWILPNPV